MLSLWCVLLVPTEDAASELLREGPCGARPPMAYLYPEGIVIPHPRIPESVWGGPREGTEKGLVLVWMGQAVMEGIDRASRYLNGQRVLAGRSPLLRYFDTLDAPTARSIGEDCERHGLGRLVVAEHEMDECAEMV